MRWALDAQPSGVLWASDEGMRAFVAAGLGLDMPLALASRRILASQLFEFSPMDALTIALFSVIPAMVAAIAGLRYRRGGRFASVRRWR